jgi:hypothetical protein
MPGTDICLKVGGYVRFQSYWNAGIAPGLGPFGGAGQVQQSRQFNASNDLVYRVRTIATFDTRQQTAYGTLRSYLLIGYTHENGVSNGGLVGANAPALYATRAFIQIAGFTFGKATSFFDFYAGALVGYTVTPASDTGDGGQTVVAYTAQLGNGVSATISAEDARRLTVSNMSIPNQFVVGANTATNNGNNVVPDIVGIVRADQAWGSAQVMAAYHNVNAAYYGATATGAAVNGGPDSEAGWAVGAGIKINFPMIAAGDYFQAQVAYTQGAGKYINNTPPSAGSMAKFDGNELGVGWWTDGVYGTLNGVNTEIQLTTAWGVNAAYEHVWTPSWKTSIYGGYFRFSYNDTAKSLICANPSGGAGTISNLSNCDPDFRSWWVGTRTQWTLDRGFYLGVDVLYQKLDTAHAGTGTFTAAAGLPQPTATYTITDQDNLIVTFRAQRDFHP